MKRAAAIQKYWAAQPAGRPLAFDVYIHDPSEPGMSAVLARQRDPGIHVAELLGFAGSGRLSGWSGPITPWRQRRRPQPAANGGRQGAARAAPARLAAAVQGGGGSGNGGGPGTGSMNRGQFGRYRAVVRSHAGK